MYYELRTALENVFTENQWTAWDRKDLKILEKHKKDISDSLKDYVKQLEEYRSPTILQGQEEGLRSRQTHFKMFFYEEEGQIELPGSH